MVILVALALDILLQVEGGVEGAIILNTLLGYLCLRLAHVLICSPAFQLKIFQFNPQSYVHLLKYLKKKEKNKGTKMSEIIYLR